MVRPDAVKTRILEILGLKDDEPLVGHVKESHNHKQDLQPVHGRPPLAWCLDSAVHLHDRLSHRRMRGLKRGARIELAGPSPEMSAMANGPLRSSTQRSFTIT